MYMRRQGQKTLLSFTSLQISRCFSAKCIAWSWFPSAVWAFPRLQHARPSPILHRKHISIHVCGSVKLQETWAWILLWSEWVSVRTCHWGPGLWLSVWGGSLWLSHNPGEACRCCPDCSRPEPPRLDPSAASPAAASSWQTHRHAASKTLPSESEEYGSNILKWRLFIKVDRELIFRLLLLERKSEA